MKKINIVSTVFFTLLLFSVSISCWMKPETAFSESERRLLKNKPQLNATTLLSGEFMESFGEYTTDQFPMRDSLRTVKALFATKVLGKMDNNDIYTEGKHISKIEYPENSQMVYYAIDKFNSIYNKFLKESDCKVYLSIVPDKNYFLAPESGHLSIDYKGFAEKFKNGLPYMQYIDIFPLLRADDYYYTDSHWKQENITHVAEYLGKEMGVDTSGQYKTVTLDKPFMGVYAGQSALPTKGDALKYLTNSALENCIVTYYDDKGFTYEGEMYNMEKAHGKDSYEMFLSGTTPLVEIENPGASSDKELVMFRDSFGASLAPLMAIGYSKITVVDIRYMQSDFLNYMIDFAGKDVLFIYSTTLLNNSTALR